MCHSERPWRHIIDRREPSIHDATHRNVSTYAGRNQRSPEAGCDERERHQQLVDLLNDHRRHVLRCEHSHDAGVQGRPLRLRKQDEAVGEKRKGASSPSGAMLSGKAAMIGSVDTSSTRSRCGISNGGETTPISSRPSVRAGIWSLVDICCSRKGIPSSRAAQISSGSGPHSEGEVTPIVTGSRSSEMARASALARAAAATVARASGKNARPASVKRFKRVALRCEKTKRNFASIVALAAAFVLVKSVHTV